MSSGAGGALRGLVHRQGAVALAFVGVAMAAATTIASGACSTTLEQPTDAGPSMVLDVRHPPPSMYGAPCEMQAVPPETCCGEVAKPIPGLWCYGCTGPVAFALCTGGAFTCACTCSPPMGYEIVKPDATFDCGVEEGGLGDAAEEAAQDAGPDASAPDAPPDAAFDAEAGRAGDAHEGG